MGMSLHVFALRAEDDKFKKHIAVFRACREAGVPLPEATKKYLGPGADYDDVKTATDYALQIDIDHLVKKESGNGSVQRVIVLKDLPEGACKLVFEAAW